MQLVTVTPSELEEWLRMNAELKILKLKEMLLRKKIAACVHQGNETPGTKKLVIGNLEAKATNKLNYTVDKQNLEVSWNELSPMEQSCFRWSAEVALKQYHALEDKSNVSEFITAKPGAPTLEVINHG